MKFWKAFFPVIILFIILTLLIVLLQNMLAGYGFNVNVLLWGNVFLFLMSLLSFLIQQKGTNPAAPQLFVRYFYLSFIIKFLLVATTVLIYSAFAGRINKAAVIACMAFYLVYMFVEITIVLKSGRPKNG
jgi:hypothetical protein